MLSYAFNSLTCDSIKGIWGDWDLIFGNLASKQMTGGVNVASSLVRFKSPDC